MTPTRLRPPTRLPSTPAPAADWGGMERELCSRASLSPKFVSWLDLEDETCGHSFSHIQHEYGERVSHDEHKQNTTFDNSEHWGLNNETLLEWVF